MIDEDFRTALHDRLGPALDELTAPDLLSGVQARQVKHKRSVRAGLAVASAATVAAIVVAVAIWPNDSSAGPAAPVSSPSIIAIPSAAVSASVAPSVVPSPSTAVVDLSVLAPLVTSGPCAGLTVGAFVPSRNIHPAVTALTAAGTSFTMGSGQGLDLRTTGPCVDRLSFLPRTDIFQESIEAPYSFHDGEGLVITRGSAINQTGVVQLFLDCKGLVCSASGAPLVTVTVRVRGTGLGAGAQPFPAAPTPLPVPTGEVVTVPSVLGLALDNAVRVLRQAGVPVLEASATCPCAGSGPRRPGVVLTQSPAAGALVPMGSAEYLTLSGDGPALSPNPAPASHPAVPATQAAGPSLPPPTTAAMPSVVGLQLAHAERVLSKADIVYAVTSKASAGPSGMVLAQSPVAGAIVAVTSKVVLTVSGVPQ